MMAYIGPLIPIVLIARFIFDTDKGLGIRWV